MPKTSAKTSTKTSSRLVFSDSLPSVTRFGSDAFLIYDRRLLKVVPKFRLWVKRFAASYGVDSGEGLKDVRAFPGHIEKILKLTQELGPRRMKIVVAGGGSVGDFGGFVASIFKRGVPLIHVPTTWLAAIDSSHGGKTALNVAGGKNQIGTFYPATEVHLVKSILRAQPEARAREGCGELAKIALIDGGAWARRLEREAAGRDSGLLLWRYLRDAIQAKYRVVEQDPREEKGIRQLLNLGHTLGHVLEASMGLAHGEAVTQGTFFALGWSFTRGHLTLEEHGRARQLLEQRLGLQPFVLDENYMRRRPRMTEARRLLLQDKKRDARGKVTFIFLKRFGHAVRESVLIEDLLHEAHEQGWLK